MFAQTVDDQHGTSSQQLSPHKVTNAFFLVRRRTFKIYSLINFQIQYYWEMCSPILLGKTGKWHNPNRRKVSSVC